MTFDPTLQRRIMGQFATGVTLLTTRYGDDGAIWAMTANSFTSLSLDPPLILVNIDRRSMMHECIVTGQCFAVNILSSEQEHVSRQFAARGPKDFSNLDLVVAKTGAPILVGSLAFLDCELAEVAAGGDHDIFVGRVVAGGVHPDGGQPLVFFNGRYTRLVASGMGGNIRETGEMLEEAYGYYGSF